MPAICATESRFTHPTATDTPYMALMPRFNTSCTHRRRWHYLPSLLVLIGITYLSLIKQVPITVMEDIPLADKWGHMLAYLVLALCLASDGYRARLSATALFAIALLLPLIYGGMMEWAQYYFPPRRCEWLDWVADAIGTIVGVGLFAAYYFIHKTNFPTSAQ